MDFDTKLEIYLPPRGRRRLLWWASAFQFFGGLGGVISMCKNGVNSLNIIQQVGVIILIYNGFIFGGMVFFTNSDSDSRPRWFRFLLITSKVEAAFESWLWSNKKEHKSDKIDRTWVIPLVALIFVLIQVARGH